MRLIKLFLILAVLATSTVISQDKKLERPEKYRIGLDLGLNYNMVGLGYQDLSPNGGDFPILYTNDGTGIAPYFGLRAEYISTDWWGIGLQVAYDDRSALAVDQSYDIEPEYDITNTYINVAPYLKINEFILKGVSAHVGPVLAFKMAGEFDYDPMNGQPATSGLEATELDDMTFGAQAGFSYDIRVAPIGESSIFVLSPFIEGSWLISQKAAKLDEQDGFDDTWTTITARLGVTAAIDFIPNLVAAPTGGQYATVLPPYDGKVIQRVVEESFPLIPYVFFNPGEQNLATRYSILSQGEANNFNKNEVLDLTDNKALAGQTATNKKLAVYHEILNIYAQELKDDDDLTVQLIGSAPKANDGDVLANTVRDYLVNIHGIDASRITTKGQKMPRIPSGSSGTPVNDRPLADVENRRVEFVFSKPDVYKMLDVKMIDEYPIDNDIVVSLNPNVKYSSWNVSITNEEGKRFDYGPFFGQVERISPYEILKNREEGEYSGNIEIVQPDGQTLIDKTEFNLVKEMDDEQIGERYTIIFNYGQADAIKNSEKDLRTKVAPRVDNNELLVISGHTDPIGKTQINAEISQKRANEARDIFMSEFTSQAKKDNIISYGYGEQYSAGTYDNTLPEGRMYNRNVTIDIVPTVE